MGAGASTGNADNPKKIAEAQNNGKEYNKDRAQSARVANIAKEVIQQQRTADSNSSASDKSTKTTASDAWRKALKKYPTP